jgi:predicted nuclease with RNAse H fold
MTVESHAMRAARADRRRRLIGPRIGGRHSGGWTAGAVYGGRVLTVGVDLAAEPAGTALATIEWSSGRAGLVGIHVGVEDRAIVDAVTEAGKAGVDCPLGWPAAFVEFVRAHHAGHVVAPTDVRGLAWRRRLAYRVTDEVVHRTVGRLPLSVAADRIGHTAMRAAALLAVLAERGCPVDRSGTGVVVEVYPAASLRVWGLPDRGYKRTANLPRLAELVDRLQTQAPWLDLGAYEARCRASDHAFDAVVAALTARATALGLATRPGREHLDTARTEGWIAVPTSSLNDLRP